MDHTVNQMEAMFNVTEMDADREVSNDEITLVYQSGELPGIAAYGDVENRQQQMYDAGKAKVEARRTIWRDIAVQMESSFNNPTGVILASVGAVLRYEDFLTLSDAVLDAILMKDRTASYNIDGKHVNFLDAEGNLLATVTAVSLMASPGVITDFLMGQDGVMTVAECIAANLPESDALADAVNAMVEGVEMDARHQAIMDQDPTVAVLNAMDLAEGGTDYMRFEEYLDTMRRLHQHEAMGAEQQVQFDQAMVYRWRDIKALRGLLAQVELNPNSNAMTRYVAEMRSLGDRLDSVYLELRHARKVMEVEVHTLRKEAQTMQKKGKQTTAGILIKAASRIEQQMQLLPPLPPEAVDALTRTFAAYREEQRRWATVVAAVAKECKERFALTKDPTMDPERVEFIRGFINSMMMSVSSAWLPPEDAAKLSAVDVEEAMDMVLEEPADDDAVDPAHTAVAFDEPVEQQPE